MSTFPFPDAIEPSSAQAERNAIPSTYAAEPNLDHPVFNDSGATVFNHPPDVANERLDQII
jgi:hypothetical protein